MSFKIPNFNFKEEMSKRAMQPILEMFGSGEHFLKMIAKMEAKYKEGVTKNGKILKMENDECLSINIMNVSDKLRLTFCATKIVDNALVCRPFGSMNMADFLKETMKS